MNRGLVGGAGKLLLAIALAPAAGLAVAEDETTAEAPPACVEKVEKVVEKPAPLRHGVFRFTSYPAAWTAAQETNRPILVFVTSGSCPHCSRMLDETYQASRVKEFVGDSFETVFVDRSEQPALAAKLHVRWFPTTLVVGPDNQVMDIIEGYVDPAAFSRRLQTTLAAHAAETQTR
jgi:thioredoxin-like negative regulator of GroEL